MRFAIVGIVAACGCGRVGFDEARAQDAAAAPVEVNIQRGTATMAASATALTVLINQVVPAHAILLFGLALDTLDPGDGMIAGQLESRQLRFARDVSGAPVTISWTVIEAPSVLHVQRGLTMSAGPGIPLQTVPIVAVDRSNSFVLASSLNSGGGFDEDDFLGIRLSSSDLLTLHVGTPVGGSRLPTLTEWQVVTIEGAAVEHGTTQLAASVGATTVPITTADPNSSVVAYTWSTEADVPAVASNIPRGMLTGMTELTFDRGAAATSLTVDWSVIRIPGVRIQSGIAKVADGATGVRVSIDAVNVERSVVLLPGLQRFSWTSFPGIDPDDRAPVGMFTAELSGPNAIVLTRGTPIGASEVSWSVLEL